MGKKVVRKNREYLLSSFNCYKQNTREKATKFFVFSLLGFRKRICYKEINERG